MFPMQHFQDILWHIGRRRQTSENKQRKQAIPLYCDDQILGGSAAEEETRDLVELTDEDGNSVLTEVVRYFFYNGEEYVVLGEVHEDDCDCEACEHCDHDHEEEAVNVFIMKVVETEEDGEEMEEFLPVDDEDLLEKLIEVVEADFEADEAFDE